ncbi:MAG: polysaccharide deacetylase family protein [Saccharofermentans sp.]|nr:polysaccharide deacetylase family protein [Saccharofermentans sp.]
MLKNKMLAGFLAAVLSFAIFSYAMPAVNAGVTGLSLTGTCHVQDQGDTEGVIEGEVLRLGTRGLSRRLESITVNLTNETGLTGDLEYRTHIQNIGWTDWVSSGTFCGTSGRALRLEAIELRLTGELAEHYDVVYQAHIQDYGDGQGWVSNGLSAGTTGESKRVEEIRIKIVDKTSSSLPQIAYRTHIQNEGWECKWSENGSVSGSTGKSQRLEGIRMSLYGSGVSGSIKYRTHVQDIGWQGWVSDGELAGTTGQSKRLEAIQITLSGSIADSYNVYYRVHMQDIGWLGWVSNGATAGSDGFAARLEAIQTVILPKGQTPDSSLGGINQVTTYGSFSASTPDQLIECGMFNGWVGIGANTYYISNGKFVNGLTTIDGSRYLFRNNLLVKGDRVIIDNILYYMNPNGSITRTVDGGRPMIALTFDDGPTRYTGEILDTLQKYNSVATFFVIGSCAAGRKSDLQREYALGCQIGNHTYNHPTLSRCSAEQIRNELRRTDDVIEAAVGTRSTIMRPPGGSFDQEVRDNCGMPIILWSVDTRDWDHRNSQKIIDSVLGSARDGSIVLMHDRLSCTATAVRTIVPTLVSRGYQLVTVEELAMFRGGLTAGKAYRSIK